MFWDSLHLAPGQGEEQVSLGPARLTGMQCRLQPGWLFWRFPHLWDERLGLLQEAPLTGDCSAHTGAREGPAWVQLGPT